MNPVDIVQRQLEAYNARDLAAFLACFADDIRVFRLPLLEPSLSGKAQMAEFYATQRFNCPILRAEILNRVVLGNKVFDHERIFGVLDEPFEMVVVFEVQNNLIQSVFSFSPRFILRPKEIHWGWLQLFSRELRCCGRELTREKENHLVQLGC